MSRLDIKTASRAQTVVDRLYKDMERRIASSPPGLCPIDMSLTFLQLCHAQSCGKCVPCRIGLGQLAALMGQVLDGTGTMLTIDTIEKTARAMLEIRNLQERKEPGWELLLKAELLKIWQGYYSAAEKNGGKMDAWFALTKAVSPSRRRKVSVSI